MVGFTMLQLHIYCYSLRCVNFKRKKHFPEPLNTIKPKNDDNKIQTKTWMSINPIKYTHTPELKFQKKHHFPLLIKIKENEITFTQYSFPLLPKWVLIQGQNGCNSSSFCSKLLGSKTLGSKCIRTSMCNVGKSWSKHLV